MINKCPFIIILSVATDLCSEIRDYDELLQYVFGQDVCVSRLLNVVWWHINMVGSQMKVCRRYGSNSPFRFGCERWCLVITGGGCDDLVSMLVDRSCRCCCELWLFLGLLLNLCNLNSLSRWSRDFHTQNDVPDLRLSQRCYIHTENVSNTNFKQIFILTF